MGAFLISGQNGSPWTGIPWVAPGLLASHVILSAAKLALELLLKPFLVCIVIKNKKYIVAILVITKKRIVRSEKEQFN